MNQWVEEETVSELRIPVDNSIYDHIVVQSDTEKRFVEKLKRRTDVRLFVKVPAWTIVTGQCSNKLRILKSGTQTEHSQPKRSDFTYGRACVRLMGRRSVEVEAEFLSFVTVDLRVWRLG
jgi:hypothetical protein